MFFLWVPEDPPPLGGIIFSFPFVRRPLPLSESLKPAWISILYGGQQIMVSFFIVAPPASRVSFLGSDTASGRRWSLFISPRAPRSHEDENPFDRALSFGSFSVTFFFVRAILFWLPLRLFSFSCPRFSFKSPFNTQFYFTIHMIPLSQSSSVLAVFLEHPRLFHHVGRTSDASVVFPLVARPL